MMKKGKSYGYQHKIMEIITDPGSLSNYSNEESISFFFSESSYSEELKELREQLLDRLREIIETRLTPHQKRIILLFLEGNTQEEIANVMSIHQTGVHKALHGNIDYCGDRKRRYGGIMKKLKKICCEDEEVIRIVDAIEKCKKEML
jgi:DNA-binding CsgD family transcriptional regulator